jgi:hypothetical protein
VAGFKSVRVAGFKSEDLAGFVGIRTGGIDRAQLRSDAPNVASDFS